MIDSQLLLKVFIASFATVGIEEYAKNFLKTEKTFVYALLMLPLAVMCYFAAEKLPVWVIGSLLTVGCVQVCYQTIVQGFKALIEGFSSKLKGKSGEKQNG